MIELHLVLHNLQMYQCTCVCSLCTPLYLVNVGFCEHHVLDNEPIFEHLFGVHREFLMVELHADYASGCVSRYKILKEQWIIEFLDS